MKPEERARATIDDLLTHAGWAVQDRARLKLGAQRGVAIREFQTANGPVAAELDVEVVRVKRDVHELFHVSPSYQ